MNIKIADPLLDNVVEFQDDSKDCDTAMRTQATMHKALGNVRKKLSGRAEIRSADAFDAATSPRIYKKAKSVVRVLWEMVDGPTRAHFDPVITKVLSHMLHPFPVGAKLKLSNGMTAVVVRRNRKAPFRPLVVIAFDRTGQRLPKERLKPPINLQEHEDLTIVSYNGEDLSYLGTTSAIPADANQSKERTELFAYAYP